MAKHIDLFQCTECTKLYYFEMDADACAQRDANQQKGLRVISFLPDPVLIPVCCPCGRS